MLIPTEAILPNPEQPRRDFDPEALKELARSIEENGILNPLSITFREGKPMLVAGERRWRAAKLAGLGELPCVEVSAADAAHGAVLTLIENMQRVDMNCFEEAEGIGRLIREYGLTQEEAALRLGYTQPTIANKLRILRLPESVRRRMAAAGLTERHARALLRLTETDKLEWVLDRILRDRLNVAQTERLVEDTLKGDPPRKRPLLIVPGSPPRWNGGRPDAMWNMWYISQRIASIRPNPVPVGMWADVSRETIKQRRVLGISALSPADPKLAEENC